MSNPSKREKYGNNNKRLDFYSGAHNDETPKRKSTHFSAAGGFLGISSKSGCGCLFRAKGKSLFRNPWKSLSKIRNLVHLSQKSFEK